MITSSRNDKYTIEKEGIVHIGTALEISSKVKELSRRGVNCFKTRGWKTYKGWKLIAINNKEKYKHVSSNKSDKPRKGYQRIKMLCPEGRIVFIDNVCKFCRKNKISSSDLYKVINNKINSAKGYRLYKKELIGTKCYKYTKTFILKDITTGKQIKGTSSSLKAYGFSDSGLSRLFKGQIKIHNNHRLISCVV